MATLNEKPQKNKAVRGKTVKAAPRVDLTAMVDLMFLLTTFFMLTTILSQPNAIDLAKPDKIDDGPMASYPQSRTMTILLGRNQKAIAYMGMAKENLMKVVSLANLQQEILLNKSNVAKLNTKHKPLIVILKPTKTTIFKDFVDALDELKMTDVKSYAVDDENILNVESNFMLKNGI